MMDIHHQPYLFALFDDPEPADTTMEIESRIKFLIIGFAFDNTNVWIGVAYEPRINAFAPDPYPQCGVSAYDLFDRGFQTLH